jgi:hypothetical protein
MNPPFGVSLGGVIKKLTVQVKLETSLLNFGQLAVRMRLRACDGRGLLGFPLLNRLHKPALGRFDLVDDSSRLFASPGSSSVCH